MGEGPVCKCIELLFSIIFPPLGVFLRFGCGLEFWISVLLTILGYIPGVIYAIFVIFTAPNHHHHHHEDVPEQTTTEPLV